MGNPHVVLLLGNECLEFLHGEIFQKIGAVLCAITNQKHMHEAGFYPNTNLHIATLPARQPDDGTFLSNGMVDIAYSMIGITTNHADSGDCCLVLTVVFPHNNLEDIKKKANEVFSLFDRLCSVHVADHRKIKYALLCFCEKDREINGALVFSPGELLGPDDLCYAILNG
ncbi:MAG: hypothetical protein ABIH21_02100 [Patescibacteria group bacterium]